MHSDIRLSSFLTRSARLWLVGGEQSWVFTPPPASWAPPHIERTTFYLHVPFCRNCCPYCPYTKVPYKASLIEPYTRAALREVDWWAERVGPAEITSIYIGGGTPTLALRSVGRVLQRVRQRFRVSGEVCIETNPADVDASCIAQLHDSRIEMVSLGVESFHPAHLGLLGRRYDPPAAEHALERLAGGSFASVNADLMFALPGQSSDEVTADLAHAAELGADQLTAYPLFTFPYTSVGEYLRLKAVRMPDLRQRRRHYTAISEWCAANTFERASVWSFKRGSAPRYSSVTRDGYIGVGPGAGSHLPDGFTLNTFDLPGWIEALEAGNSAIALRLPFTPRMSGWWWLYWRFYDTRIPLAGVDAFLGADARRARRLLGAAGLLGLAQRRDGVVELTQPGAFWLHWVQNHFALNYVNTLWTQARKQPWPASVAI